MDVDIEPILNESIKISKSGNLGEALDSLSSIEKLARNNSDLEKSTTILNHMINLCYEVKDWKILNEQIISLCKKRGQLKQAVSSMIQKCIVIMENEVDPDKKMTLIETLREVTLGKIYLEVERARISRTLAQIKEKSGLIKEAADILYELQIDTFASMERNEKIDFLLEEMRLSLTLKDFIRTQIVANKINIKYLQDESLQEKKLHFYSMMIQLALHENDYIGCANHYFHIYTTANIQENIEKCHETLKNIVLFTILSPFSLEQSDLIHRLEKDTTLPKLPNFKNLITLFIKKELMRWPIIEKIYSPILSSSFVFSPTTEDGARRWKQFKDRVIEHVSITIDIDYF